MPFAAMSKQDEERLKGQQAGVNISGGAGANFATGVPGQEGPQKSSGQYTNIQNYLDANKDQAAGMGQNVAGKIDESAADAQTKIQGLEAKAPKVDAYDPNEAYSNLGNLNDQQKSQYKDVKSTGGYSGPQSVDQVQGYSDAQKSYDTAKTRLDNSKTETGQQQLLRETYARPNYTGGENVLDQALLQNNAESRGSLENLNQKYAGLNDFFKTTGEGLGTAIESSKAQANANKTKLLAAEQDQWKGLIDPIQARANQMNIDNPALYNRVSEDTQDNILSDETLQKLGLSSGARLFDTQIGSYLQPNLTPVGLNEAANDDERARYAALAELAGDQSRTEINADGKAANPLGFNLQQFQQDLGNKQQFFDNLAKNKTFNAEYRDQYGRLLNTGSANAYDFLQQNPTWGSNPNQTALDFKYNPLVDEAPWYVDDGGAGDVESPFQPGNIMQKIGQIGDPELDIPDPRTQQANIQIKNALYQQIEDFLNSQNYNRVIQKG